MSEQDRRTAEVYVTIGEFQEELRKAIAEARESQEYTEYFDAPETAVIDAVDNEVVVQLRLYDVVCSAVNADQYLSGFRRAGISETRVRSLLSKVKEQAEKSEQAAHDGGEVTEQLYNKIMDNYNAALTTIDNVYHSAGSRGDAMAGGSGDSSTKNEKGGK